MAPRTRFQVACVRSRFKRKWAPRGYAFFVPSPPKRFVNFAT